MSDHTLPYAANGKTYRGLLNEPRNAKAAVVLLPDWRGQSKLAREHAAFLSERGCLVAIADLYGEGFSPTDMSQVGSLVGQLLAHRDQGVAALAACVMALRERTKLPLFCLGYSAGGMVALDYGRTGADVAGIIVCSALLKPAEAGKSSRIKAPLLILQGTQDVISPMDVVSAVTAEMDAAGNDFRLELYGQTRHAFDNPEAGSDPNARLCYSEASAKRARVAIADFIETHR